MASPCFHRGQHPNPLGRDRRLSAVTPPPRDRRLSAVTPPAMRGPPPMRLDAGSLATVSRDRTLVWTEVASPPRPTPPGASRWWVVWSCHPITPPAGPPSEQDGYLPLGSGWVPTPHTRPTNPQPHHLLLHTFHDPTILTQDGAKSTDHRNDVEVTATVDAELNETVL